MTSQPARRWRATATCSALLGLLAGAVVGGPGATAATGEAALRPAARVAPADGARTLTLVTGDVVHVTEVGQGRLSAQVERARGASGGIRMETIGKDLYVLPDEALPYLADHSLDWRLFDITSLLAQGFDDRHSGVTPMIIGYGDAATRAVRTPVPAGTQRVRDLRSIGAVAVRAPKRTARQVWDDLAPDAARASTRSLGAARPGGFAGGVEHVWLDGRVQADLAESTAQIGAPAAWAAGYDGKGVKVAVLDTGYDTHHPDLSGRVSATASFIPGETVQDGHGHGTHTASTVGGSGAASNGLEKGVAPGADLLIGKVLSDAGQGDDSAVIAGMEWAAGKGANVVSMSLGDSFASDGTDPLSRAVDQLTDEYGSLFVIAAGNTGSEASISAPGAADEALTVGAVDSSDQLAYFSSTGPRYRDYALKPDISAPGVDILAAKAGGSAADGWYQTMSGTSMATPHVAGAAAVLAQEHPSWKAQQLKDALMSTSKQLTDTAYQVGAGRLDLAAGVSSSVTATGSAWFGFSAWPHPDPAPVDRSITYSNSGSTAVTLHLTEQVSVAGGPYDVDPGADAGTPAPDGMFTLGADSVTVPAHGSARVVAHARPGLGHNARRYLGQVVATGASGAVLARTQVGLYLEDERHDLHVTLKDRAGQPASGYVQLQAFGRQDDPVFVPVEGETTLRLLAGTYSAVSYLDVKGSHGPDSVGVAMLGDPELVLNRDRDLVLNASKAVQATATAPRPARDRTMYLNWHREDGAGGVVDSQYLLPGIADSMFALPTRTVRTGTFEYEARWRKAVPYLTVTSGGHEVPNLGQPATSLYDGKGQVDAVYAGTGTPAELARAGAGGKVVLVTRSDAVDPMARAQAAADAGARLLLVVADRPGQLMEYVGTEDGHDSAVPVSSLTARDGAPLVAAARAGRLRLGVVGIPSSPYVYDLVDPHAGKVPADLRYRPKASELARIDVQFHGTTRYPSGEFRWDYRPYRPNSFGFWEKNTMPGTRVDYVSTQPGTSWGQSAVTGPALTLVSVGTVRSFRPGQRASEDWFGPVVRPRDGAGFYPSIRYEGWATFNVQPWSDGGAGHAGYLARFGDTFPDQLAMKVYRGGRLLKSSDWASATLEGIPTGRAKYHVDLSASRDRHVYRYSTRTHTTWDVVSQPVSNPDYGDVMPMLQLDYGVRTDLSGAAPGGQQHLTVTASHLDGAVGGGRVVRGALSVSFDEGRTWQRVRLDGRGGRWTTTFPAPGTGTVSLRAQAWDSAGNTVKQEVTRAYGLAPVGGQHGR